MTDTPLPTRIRRALEATVKDLDARVTVAPAGAEYDSRVTRADYDITVIVGIDTEEAREYLDALLTDDGQRSVRARLQTDATLGGLVSDITVTKRSGYRTYPTADRPQLGATWVATITTF